MVKSPHEALHQIFQQDATLFARAFERVLGLDFPQPRAVSVINSDLTEILPIERRVDTPLLVETADGGYHVRRWPPRWTGVELDTAAFLAGFTEVGLGDSEAAEIWRVLMTTTPYPHLMPPLRRRWREEGRVEEAVAAVLRVLQARGLTVSEQVESRVRDHTDLAELESILTRAATATRAEDIFR